MVATMLKGIIAGVALSGACIAFFTVGCSLELPSATKDAGNDQPDTGCTITLSGAATGSYPCTTTAVYLVADGGESAISVTDTTQTFQVVFEHPGIFTSESFDGGDASAWQTELLASGINGGDWACISEPFADARHRELLRDRRRRDLATSDDERPLHRERLGERNADLHERRTRRGTAHAERELLSSESIIERFAVGTMLAAP
jgi:hypothetical protein